MLEAANSVKARQDDELRADGDYVKHDCGHDDDGEAASIKGDQVARCEIRDGEKQLARELRRLEKEMLEYARNLEFEKAAAARDELFRIRQQVFGISGAEVSPDAS